MGTQTMRALVIDDVTRASDVRLDTVAIPCVRPGWTLVRVRGFGLNHAEQVLRLQEVRAPYIKRPVIPGIELVGEVADASDSGLAPGTKVCALMGGMGRDWDGSYAEFCLVRNDRLFPIPDGARRLSWQTLAAIPETYFTAWGSLFESLRVEPGDRLLVRGASCALGYAALQLARGAGCRVVATTHRATYRDALLAHGAHEVVIDDGALAGRGVTAGKVLELVGARTLRDSLAILEPSGICCQTGMLGGVEALDGFDPIKDVPNGRYLTGFFSNYPTRETIEALFTFVVEHRIEPNVAATFDLEHLPDAIGMQDAGGFKGKIVVVVDSASDGS